MYIQRYFYLLSVFIIGIIYPAFAQKYVYNVNLNNVIDDKVKVELSIAPFGRDTAFYSFPKTIPGTYATQDYGKYIDNLEAFDNEGKLLKVKKKGNNTFVVHNAKYLTKITYWVNDSWDAQVKKDKIFEPAGSNIEARKNYVINTGAFFGFLEGFEKVPVEVMFFKPDFMLGVSAMRYIEDVKWERFVAEDYHKLIDCPILFAQPDTARFFVGKAIVTIACYHESGERIAKKIYSEIKESMGAIEKFLVDLPVQNYNFLVYVKDYKEIGKQLQDPGSLSLMKKIKLAKKFKNQGFGALEHSNSSLYFLPDFGGDSYLSMVKDVCIHEFMHIITPLNLHSELIGNFNYTNPKMSQHLWLYEGITEYFSGIIQVKGGIQSPNKYIQEVVKSKIAEGENFPVGKMSFTEMSKNVLVEPYKKQYNQVYARGAVIGMLLDFEIMRLTNGEKTLKDVVLAMTKKYGPNVNVPEEDVIKEFVAEVNPELQKFFDKYVSGKDSLDYISGFDVVGINYVKNKIVERPRHPIMENDVQLSSVNMGGYQKVKSVGTKEWAGIKAGDIINMETIYSGSKDENGNYLKEGEVVTLQVLRNNAPLSVSFPAKITKGFIKRDIINPSQKTADKDKLYKRWINN